MHDGKHAEGLRWLLINTADPLSEFIYTARSEAMGGAILNYDYEDKFTFQGCTEVFIWLPIVTSSSDQFLTTAHRAP